MKTTTLEPPHRNPITLLFAALVAEKDRLETDLLLTPLGEPLTRHRAASDAWFRADTPETRKALREADLAMEDALLAAPQIARIYVQLLTVRIHLAQHRAALRLTGRN